MGVTAALRIGLAVVLMFGAAAFWAQNRRLKRTEELLATAKAQAAAMADLAETRKKALENERDAADERAARLNRVEEARRGLEREMADGACDVDSLGDDIFGRLCGDAAAGDSAGTPAGPQRLSGPGREAGPGPVGQGRN
jgi:hypothetical protein